MKFLSTRNSLPLLVALLLTLPGCSWLYGDSGLIRTTENDYVESQQSKDLELPPGYQVPGGQDLYPVPAADVVPADATVGKELEVKAPQLILAANDGIRAANVQSNPQVWIKATESEIVDSVRRFLAENSVPVAQSDADGRSVQTDWVDDGEDGWFSSVNRRDRFLLTIAEAPLPSEIAVSVTHLDHQAPVDGDWQAQPVDRGAAVDFLNRFIGFYDGYRNQLAQQRVLGLGGIVTTLSSDANGRPVIIAEKSQLAVWDSVPGAFKRLGFEVIDKDQTAGIYYLEHQEPDEGFFSSLFGGSDVEPLTLPYGNYQLKLTEQGAQTQMRLLKEDGAELPAEEIAKVYPQIAARLKSRQQKRDD